MLDLSLRSALQGPEGPRLGSREAGHRFGPRLGIGLRRAIGLRLGSGWWRGLAPGITWFGERAGMRLGLGDGHVIVGVL